MDFNLHLPNKDCRPINPGLTLHQRQLFKYWRSIPHRDMDIAFDIMYRNSLPPEQFFKAYEPDPFLGWTLKTPEVETMAGILDYDS